MNKVSIFVALILIFAPIYLTGCNDKLEKKVEDSLAPLQKKEQGIAKKTSEENVYKKSSGRVW